MKKKFSYHDMLAPVLEKIHNYKVVLLTIKPTEPLYLEVENTNLSLFVKDYYFFQSLTPICLTQKEYSDYCAYNGNNNV